MGLSQRKRKRILRLRSRKLRPREGLVLVEGLRTCAEALEAEVPVLFAVASPSLDSRAEAPRLLDRLAARDVPVDRTDAASLAEISDTESPQGLLLVCEEPSHSVEALVAGLRDGSTDSGRYLVLDGIQDPGNGGTLIRAARAFALDGVVALEGTVDPWNPKAVRAAAGASFHLPVVKARWEGEAQPALRGAGVRLLGADAGGEEVGREAMGPPWALVVGGEARGPRPDLLEAVERRVAVGMPGGGDSLNAGVAGAILLHALTGASSCEGSRESARRVDGQEGRAR